MAIGTEIWYFASPETAKRQFRSAYGGRGKSETPRQSLGEFFSINEEVVEEKKIVLKEYEGWTKYLERN